VRRSSGRAAVLLTVALSVTALALSQVDAVRGLLRTSGDLHVWYHLALYAVFGLLLMRISPRWPTRLRWLALVLAVAVVLEYGERLRYRTDMEWYDVGTDAVGIAVGAAAGWLLARWTQKRSQ